MAEGIDTLFAEAARLAAGFRQTEPRLHRPQLQYQECLATLAEDLQAETLAMEDVLRHLVEKAEPGLHRMTGPSFFGWVIGGSHPMGVAADFLTSSWGQNAGNHTASPAAASFEKVAATWLLDVLGLPAQSSVGFVTGATVANFSCLAAARGEVLRRAGWNVDADGLFGAPPITVVIGDDAHTTVFSALQFLGLGHDRVVRVATDPQGRILARHFEEAVNKADGPMIAILQAGQLNTGAFDPFTELVPVARSRDAWVHVDGAFGLWAKASPSTRHLCPGVELADSWATDGHKWLQTPYDSGYAIVRDEVAHRRAMTIAASYLPIAAEGERDPSHYVPELSRRARGFASWAMMKHLGRNGIASLIEGCCSAARIIAEHLSREPGIEILNDVDLNQVICRFGSDLSTTDADEVTRRTIARLQREGTIFVTGAKWRGIDVMRISVSNYRTDANTAMLAAETVSAAFRKERLAS
ncbi:pyridoxal phosphate-dependent decarboxylase family protein [Neorhizobium galegae]|uniref:pyridoxal phosphate-dependent decarboxylase family protein n=1 Tax=Neorhizobium galegae TaxID=399 RepID=UPI002101E766|nr:aspartate aminotransferase family protein [Neorhizobium galegae]MCQ1834450.1 aspartate aminotransferase family protein [Neorhizobium galegae]UIY29975.1 aspartate aminotransferase family protein [Neorhizobium galegae]